MTTQGRRPSGGPELARWTGPDDDPPARPSLCGTHLLLHWHGPLMTGVWMSEASGFAVTPPRADSDAVSVRPVAPPAPDTGAYERTASGDSGVGTPSSGLESPDRAEEQPNPQRERLIAHGDDFDEPREPRIERYRER